MKTLLHTIKMCLLAGLCLLTIRNTLASIRDIKQKHILRQKIPFSFYGNQFKTLMPLLKNETHIGYFNGDNPGDPNQNLKYLQTQYGLAPLVLDRTYLNHRIILFDCADDETALKKISEHAWQNTAIRLANGKFIIKRPN